jgi:uncharacterized protein (TIGR02466 family)
VRFKKEDWKIFPLLICRYPDFLNQRQIDDIRNFILLQNDAKPHGAFEGNSLSTHNQDHNIFLPKIQKEISSCPSIVNDINYCINETGKEYGLDELEATNSWYNIQQEDSVLISHIHPQSIMSGVIFINADENSTKLQFENLNKHVHYFRSHDMVHTEYTHTYFYFDPIPGTMLIFPSWLPHGSIYKNKSKNRIAISFNSQYVI